MPSSITPITLEELLRQKNELKKQIEQQKTIMVQLGRQLIPPFASATRKTNAMMRAFNTGMAIFDGVLVGIKFMKRFRKIF